MRKTNAAVPTIRRLTLYFGMIKKVLEEGEEYVSSAKLAGELGLDPVVVRKDLAVTGIVGTPRKGFPAEKMIDAISELLGWDGVNEAVLCGVGSLGRALLGYDGFWQHGLSIVAAFDVDPAKVGLCERGVPVFDVSELKKRVRRLKIRIGILTTPAEVAQDIAEAMADAGIRGIWNFTPVKLKVPQDMVVQSEDLAASLSILSHKLSQIEKRE